MRGGTFKVWPIWCDICEKAFDQLGWDYDLPLPCPDCKAPTYLDYDMQFGKAPGLITDDIPGGVEIRHGIMNDDGSPKRYYSKSDIKRACNEKGLVWGDDTPGRPYRVNWSGRRQEPEKIKPIIGANDE
jgi:hypothetical protein